MQNPEEASASESASEIITGLPLKNYSGITRQPLANDGIRRPFGVADTPTATRSLIASDKKSEPMKRRFILYRRKRGGMFYIEDTETRKQESLGTKDRAEATALLNARNESVRQPQLNLQIAKAYLAGTDSGVSTRTWQNALDAIIETKTGSTQDRWRRAAKETALDLIRDRVIIETQAEHLARLPQGRHGQHQRPSAEAPQLLPLHELAAVADHSEAPLAGSSIPTENAPSQQRNINSSSSGKRIRSDATSTNCAGILAVRKPTSRT